MAPYLCSTPNHTGETLTPASSCPCPSVPVSLDEDRNSDIAIIGFSFEFPEADTVEDFWDLMIEGRCVASEFPRNRLEKFRYHSLDESRKGTVSHRWGNIYVLELM
jgi:hypothetical protein